MWLAFIVKKSFKYWHYTHLITLKYQFCFTSCFILNSKNCFCWICLDTTMTYKSSFITYVNFTWFNVWLKVRRCYFVLLLHACLAIIGLSTKLSSTKDDILEGGDHSLNVIFNDSSTLWVFLLKTLWTLFVLKKSKRYNIIRLSVTFDV